jgi:glycopeptide antibiotics resistance protein
MKKFFDLPRVICSHLLGSKHTILHRVLIGVFVFMPLGVCVSEIHANFHLVNIALNGFGAMIHGIGCTPVIELIAKRVNR